jgi:hypothetical protein
MTEIRYTVKIDNEAVAENMRREYALVLVKALFDEYWREAAENGLTITIIAQSADVKGQ